MYKLNIPCEVNGATDIVPVYIGNPEQSHNPIQHQSNFLAKERGIVIPANIIETLEKLKDLAISHGVRFEEMACYALEYIQNLFPSKTTESQTNVDSSKESQDSSSEQPQDSPVEPEKNSNN